MGDCGSMFLGLMLGATAMNNAYTQTNPLAAIAPALILGVPLFDMLFVMYIRRRRGLPVMLGSPDHVALRVPPIRLPPGLGGLGCLSDLCRTVSCCRSARFSSASAV